MHPHISTRKVSISAKTAMSVRDRKLPSGSHLENGLGRWVQHSGSNELDVWPLTATSLKLNHSGMHGCMALKDRTVSHTSRCQSLCEVQFARLPSTSITAVAGGRGMGRGGQTRPVKCSNMN